MHPKVLAAVRELDGFDWILRALEEHLDTIEYCRLLLACLTQWTREPSMLKKGAPKLVGACDKLYCYYNPSREGVKTEEERHAAGLSAFLALQAALAIMRSSQPTSPSSPTSVQKRHAALRIAPAGRTTSASAPTPAHRLIEAGLYNVVSEIVRNETHLWESIVLMAVVDVLTTLKDQGPDMVEILVGSGAYSLAYQIKMAAALGPEKTLFKNATELLRAFSPAELFGEGGGGSGAAVSEEGLEEGKDSVEGGKKKKKKDKKKNKKKGKKNEVAEGEGRILLQPELMDEALPVSDIRMLREGRVLPAVVDFPCIVPHSHSPVSPPSFSLYNGHLQAWK